MTDLENKFSNDMINIYTIAKKECGYNATRFLQMISNLGGLEAAKQLIHKEGGSEGFTTLWRHSRLDLSVEAHVLMPKYRELFTEEEIEICKKRLMDYGYKI